MTTKQARFIRNIILAAAAFCAGLSCRCCADRVRRDGGGVPSVSVERDTMYVTDTVLVYPPERSVTAIVRDTVLVAAITEDGVGESGDSASVTLPVVSRHYGDSLYEAWVSGPVDPRLDSLRLYPRSAVVTETERIRDPPGRWGLSVGLGAAVTPRGVEPAVFAGVTYTFAAFGGR